MLTEEDLIREIIKRNNSLTREKLQAIVDEKLASHPFLTRAGALLIILEEMRLSDSLTPRDYSLSEVASLTSGLRNVSLRVRLLGVRKSQLKGGRSLTILRVGDRTGVLCALIWGDSVRDIAADLRPGDVLNLSNFQVAENKLTGSLELVGGDDAKIVRDGLGPEPPPLKTFFKTPGQATAGEGVLGDIVCILLFNGGVERIRRGEHDRTLARLVVGDEGGYYPLKLWGELAEMTSGLATGDTLLITSVRRDDYGFSSTHRTTINKLGEDPWIAAESAIKHVRNEGKIKILHVDGLTVVCTDGERVMRLVAEAGFKVGECLKTVNSATVNWGGTPYIYCQKLEPLQSSECEDIQEPKIQLESVTGLRRDLVFECILTRKGQTSTAATRYGDREVLGLWVEVDGKIYPATAWGEKSRELEVIPEGSRVKLLMAAVRRDRFGGLEIVIDDDTLFLVENGFK